MISTDTLDRIRFRGNPQAHPNAVVTYGKVRFTMLTSSMLRMEWASNGVFEDRSTFAFPNRYAPAPHFKVSCGDEFCVIDTGSLQLSYQGSGVFNAENLSIKFTLNGEVKTWYPGMPNPGNLRGTRRTLDGCGQDASLQEGLLSRDGWFLFDDSASIVYSKEGWVTARSEELHQDWYFFGYGHDFTAALTEYTIFGGKIPMIPRFVLGAWWSRYWNYSEADLKELVSGFESHGLPLDVLVIDMDWHTPQAWTGYTWNRNLFPDPPAFLAWAHSKGLKTTLNLHPAEGIQAFEEVYPHFARAMNIDPTTRQGVPFRITDPKFVQNYFELIHHPMEDDGVDFWWIDWQQGESSELKGLDPLTWLNHLHFRDAFRRGKRALIYSRWGGLGNHRYQIGFSGDTVAVWTSLQFQPYYTATASNVCYGWWTHDIGGHMGGATVPELYARWVQFGALSPVLRLHSTKDPRAERRPWIYPEPVYQAAKAAFLLRYQLIPYLYSLARTAADTGISLVRPMYYAYPDEDEAYAARYQYFLGDQMIAAPIVFPADPATGLAAADIWIPEGQWIDFTTKETYNGPGWVRILGDLNRMPMLVKSGGILPLAAPFETAPGSSKMASGTTSNQPKEKIILAVFPGKEGDFRLYEDDGETTGYEQGQYEWTEITTSNPDPSTWRVCIGAVQGCCSELPCKREYEIRLEGSHAPQGVIMNGEAITQWKYQPDSLTTVITISALPKSQALEITAIWDRELAAIGEDHNLSLAIADAKRMFGKYLPEGIINQDELLECVINIDLPGKADLVARLGGPLVRFIDFVTYEDASQQAGRIILGKYGEKPFDARIEFQSSNEASQSIQITHGENSKIIDTPFTFGGKTETSAWQANVDISWGGHIFTFTHQSTVLFPAISTWHGRLYQPDREIPPMLQTAKNANQLPAARDWTVYTEDVNKIDSLATPYYLHPWQDSYQKVVDGESIACCLATTILSDSDQQAYLVFFTKDPADFYMNGRRIPADKVAKPEPFLPYSMHPDLSLAVKIGLLHIRQGENTLVVDIHPIPSNRPSWIYSGIIISPDGHILTGLTYQ